MTHLTLCASYDILGPIFIAFWLHPKACGILVPQPGIEPAPPVSAVQNLPPGSPQKPLYCLLKVIIVKCKGIIII